MKKYIFLFILIGVFNTIWSTETENIVSNGNFNVTSKFNLPANWDYRGDSTEWISIIRKDPKTYAEIKIPLASDIFLVQFLPEFKSDKSYKICWLVKGDPNIKYRIYLEWSSIDKKKGSCKSLNINWRFPENNWTAVEYNFTAPDYYYKMPYLVIQSKGPGKIAFTDIEILETK